MPNPSCFGRLESASLTLALILTTGIGPVRGAERAASVNLVVLAASSLSEPFTEISRSFRKAHPEVTVELNFAATNELRLQIEHGARADLFAAASREEMDRALKSGIVKAPRLFTRNQLVLIVPKANRAKVTSLGDLARPGIKMVTGAPTVPVGKYTLAMLDRMAQDPRYGPGYRDGVKRNFVSFETNVKQVCAKVQFDEADAAIVYRSDVTPVLARRATAFEIPPAFNVDADYPIAVTTGSAQSQAAEQFVEFIRSRLAQEVFLKRNFLSLQR